MSQAFIELLDFLADDSKSLTPAKVAELSDLDSDETQTLTRHWNRISPDRRFEILQESRTLADNQIELTFESVNRIAIGDPEPRNRRIAIQNLWESEDPGLVPPLLEALAKDPEPDVREAAGAALSHFIYLGELASLRPELLHSIEEQLLNAAQHDRSKRVRRSSLESLGFSSRSEVPILIQSAYQSKDEAGLRTALRAMGRSADEIWAPNVLAQLHHAAPEIRVEAVQAAGELAMREAAEEIIDLLDDVHDDVRSAAIWSLGQIGGSRALEALDQLLGSARDAQESELIEAAIQNLTFFEGTRELLLLDFNETEDPQV